MTTTVRLLASRLSRAPMILILLTLAFAMIVATPMAGLADTLPAPTQRVILKLAGEIENTTDGRTAAFDRAMIEALGQETITTTTPWTEGTVVFTGVPMSTLLAYVGSTGEQITIKALNDYEATVSIEMLTSGGAMLAYKMNGSYLSLRDKGPLWLVFPYDSDERYRSDNYSNASVWQIRSMTVR